MVTPIMSTNQLSGLKKRSPTESQRVAKYQTQQQPPPPQPKSLSSSTEEPAKLSKETYEKQNKSDKNLKEESQSLSGSSTSQNGEDQERDSDSGSSQNSSDIENALASIEPMQPINLERPSMHNLMYRKSAQPNASNGQPSQQSRYSAEDYSDNSER